MTSHTTVGIYDDFATGQASIALRTTNYETTSGIDVVFSVFVQHFCRNYSVDNVFDDVFTNLSVFNFRSMLGRNYDSIDTNRFTVNIFNSYLSFAVRTEVRKHAGFANLGQTQGKFVSQVCRHGHQGFGFIGCITKHHTLVASTGFFFCSIAFFCFQSFVNAHSNVGRLFVNGNQHTTGVTVKTIFCTVITNFNYSITSNASNINIAGSGNFTNNVDLTSGYNSFTSNTTFGVLCQNSI